jgi:hypothetical protein
MLIEFASKQSASVLMFGDVAKELVRLMGFTESLPNAVAAEDIPKALARLKAGLEAHEQAQRSSDHADEEDDGTPSVSLSKRAMPLIQMLEKAQKSGDHVTWGKGT